MSKTAAAKKAQKKYIASRKRVSLVLTNSEYEKLKKLAEKDNSSVVGVIRRRLKLNET
ncbi:hypothetical protein G7A79_07385 [Coprococcus sp. MSK.21.13]|nr:hypothetical protein [Coprococcus sp. MSK.21.13]